MRIGYKTPKERLAECSFKGRKMFIIYGFGKTTTKDFGCLPTDHCTNCNNQIQKRLIRVRTWFTLFFIPIIPYRTRYFLICPICRKGEALNKGQFLEYAQGFSTGSETQTESREHNPPSSNAESKYAGKNETQINFLKQMEENEKREAEHE